MIVPRLGPGIVEWRELSSRRVVGGDIGALGDIALKTGPRQVVEIGRTTVFAGNDVIEVVRKRAGDFGLEAILTARLRPLPDAAAHVIGNRGHRRFDVAKALAFKAETS
ncbi:MAG: hypothetical protein HY657_10780 [Acidobacteria bacterium]|nr:hypothetical protein [Acidobacteriota bacterium]